MGVNPQLTGYPHNLFTFLQDVADESAIWIKGDPVLRVVLGRIIHPAGDNKRVNYGISSPNTSTTN